MGILKQMVFTRLENQEFTDDDEIFLHLILLIGLALAFLIHFFFLVFFIIVESPLFIFANVMSLITYVVVFFLHRNKRYMISGLLLTIEISTYTLIFGLVTGLATGAFTFYFITLLIQAIIPYGKPAVRVGAAIYVWACLTVTLVLGTQTLPLAPFSQELTTICCIMNVEITFIGVMAVLVVAEYIHRLIAEYRKQKIEEYREKAHRDPLTGQHNRHYADLMWSTLSQENEWVVAMLDIDDFKRINDRFGHAVGDKVLVTISNLLSKKLRSSDIIIRWGGEEFLILLQNGNLATAEIVLEKLRVAVEDLVFTANNETFSITVSIGMSLLNHDDIEGSIAVSDRKLYASKSKGKNQVSV